MERLEWKTEQRKVRDLIPTDYNPRKRNEEKQKKLHASIDKFNLVEIPDQFKKDICNPDNEIHQAYHKGKATGQYTMDKSLFDNAKNSNVDAPDKLDQRQSRKRIDTIIHENFGL
ncbi:MAG TPA: hypothetical protein DEQ30_05015 [Porphyromonadaceae bacterium]|nr:hypothetical protein [Porphyromonadaceae bacterium]